MRKKQDISPVPQETPPNNPVFQGEVPKALVADCRRLLASANDTPLADFPALQALVEDMLSKGWRDAEIQAAFVLDAMSLNILRSRANFAEDGKWWATRQNAPLMYNGQRRARLITSTGSDLAVHERLDPAFAPKQNVEHKGEIEWKVTVAPFMLDREKRKIIDAEVVEKK